MRGARGTSAGSLDGGQTTLPATVGTAAPEGDASLTVRWVFPDRALPPTGLDAERVLLGRGEDCDRELTGRQISRHHAEIVRRGRLHLLRDLGSTNGIRVNGKRHVEAPIGTGDVIRLGEWLGVVCEGDSAPARTPFRTLPPAFFVGPVLGAALDVVERAAKSDLPVVLEGETGTGKECVARAIHGWSGRTGAFVAVNCAALPEALAEAELFGYRAGAFTGATQPSEGHFRAARAGTLLLDEVTELPLPAQAKLLRVLEQGEVTPLGESRPVPCSARIVAASQQALADAVSAGRFRADLLARLDGITTRLPPLRERRLEVPYLLASLLEHHAGGPGLLPKLDPALVEALCLYDWPFNVRELDRLVRRLLVLHGHEKTVKLAHLPEPLRGELLSEENGTAGRPNAGPANGAVGRARASRSGWKVRDADRDAAELTRLREALRRSDGNVSRAAATVGISRQRAYRLMNGAAELELAVQSDREAPA